jgi:integrase
VYQRLTDPEQFIREAARLYRDGDQSTPMGEIILLDRNDIDLDRGRIRIRRLKGGLSGERNLLPLLCQYLTSRRDKEEALFVGLQGSSKREESRISSASTHPKPAFHLTAAMSPLGRRLRP